MDTNPASPEGREPLLKQIQDLDNRFWIVNTMEMFERLAYYGVRAVVAIYMVLALEEGGPEFNHTQKGVIFAMWAFVQSLLPVFTGGFADRYGHKKTISVAIAIKIAGYLVMGWRQDLLGFAFGCFLLAAGTAIFKPGVQGTLAATMKKSSASVGWGLFYQIVNVGGFLGPVVAESLCEVPVEPFRIIARDARRHTRHVGCVQALTFVIAQHRRTVVRAVCQFGNRVGVEPAFALEHAEQNRARRFRAHQECARSPASQRVINQTGDTGAVAGTGEAMRQTPGLERVAGRTAVGLKRLKDFNGGGKFCGGGHDKPNNISTAKMIHIANRMSAPIRNALKRCRT